APRRSPLGRREAMRPRARSSEHRGEGGMTGISDRVLERRARRAAKEAGSTRVTPEQANAMVLQLQAAERGEIRYLDVVMPNGKPMGDCTGDYLYRLGSAMQALALRHKLMARSLWGRRGTLLDAG